ncbi:hypothetical protein N0V92_000213 [Colletotrichum tropicale]|nr:hypothetical protein N0V92_000213 [Colletotrichum tropicale]
MLEIIPAFVFGFGLPWIPETPRWLVEHNQKDRARSTLRRLRKGIYSEDQIEDEFAAISKDVDEYHRSGRNWLSLFKEKALFSRLWRATLLQFMSQACGASAMNLGFGPTVWVYNTEIFPTAVRARGLNFASVGSAVASMIVNEIWPIGLAKLHSKVYFIFMAVNIIWIPVLFAFFPETKGRELEDMDALFGSVAKQVSDAEDGKRKL